MRTPQTVISRRVTLGSPQPMDSEWVSVDVVGGGEFRLIHLQCYLLNNLHELSLSNETTNLSWAGGGAT